MDKHWIHNKIRNLKLFTTLTGVFLFSAPSYSALKCTEILSTKARESYPRELSDAARAFWDDVSTVLKQNLDHDFQREANKRIYSEQIKMAHPSVEFYKSLGFEVTSDGTFRAPPLRILLSRLSAQIAQLNQQLKDSGADLQISPKLFLELRNEDFDQQQRVILDPFQSFWAPGYKLTPRSNILKTLPYYRFIASGGFPIGGIESASGLSRTMVEVSKTRADTKLRSRPHISDFLHDLGHLSAFLRNPQFAAAYVRVFRSQLHTMQRMDPETKMAYIEKLEKPGAREWRRNFYFSESAWIVHKDYQAKLNQYPILSAIIKRGRSFNSKQIADIISQVDKIALMNELERVKADWWKLFDPMGGAVNDMISMDAFSPNVRSNFIVQRVLRELETYLSTDRPFQGSDQSSLAIILGFLRNSPRMSTSRWEYFGRSDNWKSSEVFRALQDMFPEGEVVNLPDWSTLFEFLYTHEN